MYCDYLTFPAKYYQPPPFFARISKQLCKTYSSNFKKYFLNYYLPTINFFIPKHIHTQYIWGYKVTHLKYLGLNSSRVLIYSGVEIFEKVIEEREWRFSVKGGTGVIYIWWVQVGNGANACFFYKDVWIKQQ